MAFPPAAKPISLLGYHRILSPTAGVRVSPLCLGTMNFGDAWKGMLGECDKKTSFEIMDYFFEQGGNFLDTANSYQAEDSEEWIGEWIQSRGNRDQLVLATKYTTGYLSGKGGEKIKSNYQGNHAKSLRLSVDASLKKLQTDYLDILYIHYWDFSTSIPELMLSLNRLVTSGKVLYLGISDTPAWVVSKANEYARNHGLTQFSVYQGLWNASDRDIEREIVPMCEAEGMALAIWGSLGQGRFKSRAQRESGEGRTFFKPTEKEIKISDRLEDIANKRGTTITSVALAYVTHKAPYVYPIVGGRKIEHLKGNIEALGLKLTTEEIDEIEDVWDFELGFPMNMLFGLYEDKFKYKTRMTTADMSLVRTNAWVETPEKVKPVEARAWEEKEPKQN